jgi:hypothetical protein
MDYLIESLIIHNRSESNLKNEIIRISFADCTGVPLHLEQNRQQFAGVT